MHLVKAFLLHFICHHNFICAIFWLVSDGSLFRIDVILNEGVSVLEWRLHDELDEDADYGFKSKPGGSKIEINLKKKSNIHWTSFGTPGS